MKAWPSLDLVPVADRAEVERVRRHIEAGMCPWCSGGPFLSLGQHTRHAHDVSARQLREAAFVRAHDSVCDSDYSGRVSRQRKGKLAAGQPMSRGTKRTGPTTKAGRAVLVSQDGTVFPDRPARLVHGTTSGYTNFRCRCSECRAAWRDHHREYTHRVGLRRPQAVVNAERHAAALARDNHGTVTRYSFGCRCEVCRAANAAAQRRKRAASRAKAV